MIQIAETIIILTLAILAIKLVLFFKRRVHILLSLHALGRLEGVEVKITSIPAILTRHVSKKPAASIRVRDKTYAVRIYGAGGSFKRVHIASKKYTVVFSVVGKFPTRRANGLRGDGIGAKHWRDTISKLYEGRAGAFSKVVSIPPLDAPDEHIPIMLFAKAPKELTYVSAEKTRIRIAFTGDEVVGHKMFTRSTLLSYIDRDSRGFYDKLPKSEK